jgi:hypothetical protein
MTRRDARDRRATERGRRARPRTSGIPRNRRAARVGASGSGSARFPANARRSEEKGLPGETRGGGGAIGACASGRAPRCAPWELVRVLRELKTKGTCGFAGERRRGQPAAHAGGWRIAQMSARLRANLRRRLAMKKPRSARSRVALAVPATVTRTWRWALRETG